MKNIQYLLIALGASLLLSGCQPKEKVVERPAFGVRNSTTLEIDKIVMNDTATIFYVDAYFHPKYWIRIDTATYLKAGDTKYPILRGEGIKLGDYHWMPESGESSFRLIFPPIDRSLDRIDFIESDCEDCFKIWDIELKSNISKHKSAIPEEVTDQKFPMEGTLPAPDLKVGRTTLKVHLDGYKKEMGKSKVLLYVDHLLKEEQEELEAFTDENGNVQFDVELYGTSGGYIHTKDFFAPLLLAPGETQEVYVDLYEVCKNASKYQKGNGKEKPNFYPVGKYAALNYWCMNEKENTRLVDDYTTFLKDIEGKDADRYVGFLMDVYRNKVDSLNRRNVPEYYKQYLQNKFKSEVVYYISMGDMFLRRAFEQQNKASEEGKNTEFKVPEFTEQQWAVLKELDVNNDYIFYGDYTYTLGGACRDLEGEKLVKVLGADRGPWFDYRQVMAIPHRFENLTPMTDEQKEMLAGMENPFYKEAFETMEKRMQERLEANKSKTGYKVCEVPKVGNKQLFDAIIKPYRGKVILVDCWATWCGPCRQSIKQLEPEKDEMLKDGNIAFVYLTGESSPLGTWMNMIPDIKGDHYRLSKEQWNYVCDSFGIEGIPSYILVDKQGNYKLRNDLRDHNKLKQNLLTEAQK